MRAFYRKDRSNRISIPIDVMKALDLRNGSHINITIEYGKICITNFDTIADISKVPFVGIVREVCGTRFCIPSEYLNVLGIYKKSHSFCVSLCSTDNNVTKVIYTPVD